MPDFYLDGVAVSALPGESVLAACQRNGVKLPTVCKGRGMCAACRVLVEEAFLAILPPPSVNETRLLTYLSKGEPGHHRLGCQIFLDDALNGLRLERFPLPTRTV